MQRYSGTEENSEHVLAGDGLSITLIRSQQEIWKSARACVKKDKIAIPVVACQDEMSQNMCQKVAMRGLQPEANRNLEHCTKNCGIGIGVSWYTQKIRIRCLSHYEVVSPRESHKYSLAIRLSQRLAQH